MILKLLTRVLARRVPKPIETELNIDVWIIPTPTIPFIKIPVKIIND